MGKYFKILMLTLSVLSMVAGTALAGVTTVNNSANNSAYTAALEGMAAARNVVITGASNGPIAFQTTQNATTANFLSVVFTGAAFAGNTVQICEMGAGANIFGTATPAAGTTSFNFQFNFGALNNISAGNVIYLTTDAACSGTGANNFIVQLATTTVATSPSVTLSVISAGNIPVDPTGTAQLASIAPEYSIVAGTTSAHVVDFLGLPGSGRAFTVTPTGATNATAGSSNILDLRRSTKAFGAFNGSSPGGATNGAGVTVAAAVMLSDTAAWQGVSKVFVNTFQGGLNCTDSAASNQVGTGAPAGTIVLNLPAAAYNGIVASGAASNAVPVSVCIKGDGTTSLAARTIQAAANIFLGAGGGTVTAPSAFANADVWTLNAYQTWIPWFTTMTTIPTYCLINNADTTLTGNVILDVVSSEGAVVIANQSLGTIAAKTSKLATFTGTSVSLTGGTAVDVSALGANTRFSARLTFTVSPTNTSVTCVQTDPATGAKRNVITLQNGGTWTF
jgi:hypothetical protein